MIGIAAGYRSGTASVRRQEAFTKRDFSRNRLVFKLLVLGAFVVFLSLFTIWSRVQIVEVGYRINELQRETTRLENKNRMLKLELSLMTSPERIGKIATERLGMGPPPPERIVTVE